MHKNLIIAIDGFSACGKSTIAKLIAKKYNLIFVDTGAMYRAVTLYFLRNEVNLSDELQIILALDNIDIKFELIDATQHIFLNGEDVSSLIRNPEINNNVSNVAKISKVRRKMVALQQSYAEGQSIIMDGRDIGTVVFPFADLKFFMTANIEIRTQRRLQELINAGVKSSYDEVESNLKERDFIDSNREDSPLRQADDAILIDNSTLSVSEQVDNISKIIDNHLKNE